MSKVVIGIIIACVVVLGGALMLKFVNSGTVVQTSEVSSANTFSYTIEGEVVKPGTYTLSDVVCMSDLIEAAGGTTSNADDLCYFDNATLTSGSTYYIGSKYDSKDICSSVPIVKANINADDAAKLSKIDGITSSIATSIVSYRSEVGTFRTIEDLLDVYGIGNATYRKIRNYVTLHE